MIPGVLKRAADPAGKGFVIQAAAGDDRPERDRQAGIALPPAAQIGQQVQAVGRIGKPCFVNDQAGIDLTVAHGRHNLIKGHDHNLGGAVRHLLGRP
ncbi:hypothetical protein D3C73_1323750 [compost metagenome]